MTVVTDSADRALLGIGPNAAAREINDAYRRRMRDIHPDLGRDDDQEVHELMAHLADARRRLLSEPADLAGDESETVQSLFPETLAEDPSVSARTVQRTIQLFVFAAILVMVALMVFSVIAFSQSG